MVIDPEKIPWPERMPEVAGDWEQDEEVCGCEWPHDTGVPELRDQYDTYPHCTCAARCPCFVKDEARWRLFRQEFLQSFVGYPLDKQSAEML